MKKKFSAEKTIYISLISLFCVISIVLSFKIYVKVEKLSSVTPVVIHDITTTSIEERGNKKAFVTPSGKKYHLNGCAYLSENKIPITIDEALKSGYESCSKCQP